MLPLIAAAVVVSGLGDRPQTLLGTDGKGGYLAKLEAKLNTTVATEKFDQALPDCQNLVASAMNYSEVAEKDVGNIANFYSRGVINPVIIEHVDVSGCGKKYRLNVVAQRFIPDDGLHFLVIAPGDTLVGIAKQRDAYTAAALAIGFNNKAKGRCDRGVVVYDTKVLNIPSDPTAPWDEVWYMTNCGVNVAIKVNFKPKSTGSGLDVDASLYKEP